MHPPGLYSIGGAPPRRQYNRHAMNPARAIFLLSAAGLLFTALTASVTAQSFGWLRTAPSYVEGQRPTARPRQGQVPPLVAKSGPDPREATARRLCTQCHPFENVVAIRRTRSQWEATVENMVGRGARGSSDEFATVIDFLSEKYGLSGAVVRGSAGPDDKPLVDPKAVEIGEPLWASDCSVCHGKDARGTPKGPNL